MRLLDTETFELREFFDDAIPQYAILSHTWGKEEVLFQDMTDITRAKLKHGFHKLEGACQLARSQSYKYIWIDTCCIDKTSSAELTEAINSMYRWYKGSGVCYAYLSDIGTGNLANNSTPVETDEHVTLEYLLSKMPNSRWFTRGWTLQELIAPSVVKFYTSTWRELGNKHDARMSRLVSDITGIDVPTLLGDDPSEVSIARRMFWASKRETTRLEDRAYSLLGLFDVNMPLIYGEGKRAFRRLQEEILKTSDDQSIFAWHSPDYPVGAAVEVLATSPSDFASSGAVSRHPFFRVGRKGVTVTSEGISCQLSIAFPIERFYGIQAILDCQLGSIPGTFPTINLRSVSSYHEGEPRHFYRVMTPSMRSFRAYGPMDTFTDESYRLGLDPTHLRENLSEATIQGGAIAVKNASIVFIRRLPIPPRYMPIQDLHPTRDIYSSASSWLRPPSSSQPQSTCRSYDCKSHWFVTFGLKCTDVNLEVRIVQVYPHEDWDSSSLQFRIRPIHPSYHDSQRECLDGMFDVEVIEKQNSGNPGAQHRDSRAVLTKTLLVGRAVAASRGANTRPWCRILGHRVPIPDAASFQTWGKTWIRALSGSRLGTSTWKDDHEDILLEAIASTKAISGNYHHVVVLRANKVGVQESGYYLLDDKAGAGDLRLHYQA
ncbi:heterokaryon incompatibility protein-domain-containing protein [Echria macrotheca]|uniref:Heterokaryon incompatibility protein-domain-containing protein n=1 Tax=Echria macrotheca TaxID=438768 RepID=A0AAJ0B9G1_9PEZI|nr:heterokaryon incompatibility protein-domain-containing protein [Echria macrotheca]